MDGIKYYEREEFLDDMGHVVSFLLDLEQSKGGANAFKLLITSPSATIIAFEDEDVLLMATLRAAGAASNQSHFIREFKERIKG